MQTFSEGESSSIERESSTITPEQVVESTSSITTPEIQAFSEAETSSIERESSTITPEQAVESTSLDTLSTITPEIQAFSEGESSEREKESSTITPDETSLETPSITTPEIQAFSEPESRNVERESSAITPPEGESTSLDTLSTITPEIQAFSEPESRDVERESSAITPEEDSTSLETPSITTSAIQKFSDSQSQDIEKETSAITPDEELETKAIPELPTVIENLASSQSLGDSKPLAQQSDFLSRAYLAESNKQQNSSIFSQTYDTNSPNISYSNTHIYPANIASKILNIQRFTSDLNQGTTSESQPNNQSYNQSSSNIEIPISWSSIEDLLSENNVAPSNNSNVETVENIIQRAYDSNYNGYDSSSNTNGKQTIVQRDAESGGEKTVISEEISSVDNSSESKEDDSNNFEILAREIYGFIRQRLEIERERRGIYNSDRLPW
ncbi:MAG: hypothetical protein F6K10_24410 [Moorea sp. SIO2B7]|nr:hypothetical protein [Moorena sp. SIO2B7]